jgi:hypothetical protein
LSVFFGIGGSSSKLDSLGNLVPGVLTSLPARLESIPEDPRIAHLLHYPSITDVTFEAGAAGGSIASAALKKTYAVESGWILLGNFCSALKPPGRGRSGFRKASIEDLVAPLNQPSPLQFPTRPNEFSLDVVVGACQAFTAAAITERTARLTHRLTAPGVALGKSCAALKLPSLWCGNS